MLALALSSPQPHLAPPSNRPTNTTAKPPRHHHHELSPPTPTTAAMDPTLFTSTQLALLAHERNHELITTTALLSTLSPSVLSRQHGLAILNLTIASQRTGLGGNTLIDLELDSAVSAKSGASGDDAGKLPAHTIRPGDIVRVEEQASGGAKRKVKAELGERGLEGVVSRVTEGRVTVAIGKGGGNGKSTGGEDADITAIDKLLLSTSATSRLWVVKVSNDTTYLRMERAMNHLNTLSEAGRLGTLHRILFGLETPSPPDHTALNINTVEFFDDTLNESQRAAVVFSLASPEVALIHGPPGTGKTQTLIELILQLALRQNKRVIVCGPSNISVDNLVLRLPSSLPVVRLGHPARLLPGVLARSLDVLTTTSEAAEIVKDVRKDMDAKLSQLNAPWKAGGKVRLKGSARKEGWAEFRALRREFRERESRCLRELLRTSKVVVATLHGAGGGLLRGERFDVGIIDEGSQALEAQCWIPILHNIDGPGGGIGKLVIAGDHLQLPPTVKSESISASNKPAVGGKLKLPPNLPKNIPTSLTTTMFSRLLTLHGEGIKMLLTTQYRMHEKIMAFPSLALYGNKLIADESVRAHLLRDLPGVQDTEDTREPVVFYDTQGGDFPEAAPPLEDDDGGRALGTESKSNPGEVLLVVMHLRYLLNAGVRMEDVAVITPYTAQLGLISAALRGDGSGAGGGGGEFENVELGSIDGFQGREKEVVILSLVRSNEERETGFLREERRLNVAATRARRALVVVGDGETLRGRSEGKGGGKVGGKEEGGDFLKRWMEWLDGVGEADVRYVSMDEAVQGAEGLL
ncbi:DNA helicase-like protein [Peziza echinospora]|nr:DNA helicase-like protein [Peziza echinospora]